MARDTSSARSETNTNDDVESFLSFRRARSSSPLIGWVEGLPLFLRVTCISAASKSIAFQPSSQISEARKL